MYNHWEQLRIILTSYLTRVCRPLLPPLPILISRLWWIPPFSISRFASTQKEPSCSSRATRYALQLQHSRAHLATLPLQRDKRRIWRGKANTADTRPAPFRFISRKIVSLSLASRRAFSFSGARIWSCWKNENRKKKKKKERKLVGHISSPRKFLRAMQQYAICH